MRRSSNATLVLTLSLFMILLCFFIVLNSLADFKESRAIPVLASLEASFASKIISPNIAPSLMGEKKPISLFAGGMVNELEMAFRNNFDVSYAKSNTSGNILQVELNRKNFIDILQKGNTVGFYAFRQKLLQFMQSGSQNYRIDILFGEKDPLEVSMHDQKLVPQLLMNAGLTQGRFKVSTRHGNPDVITLIFTQSSTSLVTTEGAE